MSSRGRDLRVLNASCAHLRMLRSFEVKRTCFEVVEYMCAHMRVLRIFELENN